MTRAMRFKLALGAALVVATLMLPSLGRAQKGTPTLGTNPDPTITLGSGSLLQDSASLSGGTFETTGDGDLIFYLFAPGVTPNGSDSNYVYEDVLDGVMTESSYATVFEGNNPGDSTPRLLELTSGWWTTPAILKTTPSTAYLAPSPRQSMAP